jgi:tetratricopeptide (TPR) repeat protein
VATQSNTQGGPVGNQEGQPGGFSKELDVAETKFQEVVDEYRAGDARLELLASHAYAQLSYVWILRGDYPDAIEMAKNALELTSPYYKGRYSALLGDIYLKSGDKVMAINAYRDGIGFAEAAGDENTVNDLEMIIDRLDP